MLMLLCMQTYSHVTLTCRAANNILLAHIVISFRDDFSPSIGKSTSGSPSIPFWCTVLAIIALCHLAPYTGLHVDRKAILYDVAC